MLKKAGKLVWRALAMTLAAGVAANTWGGITRDAAEYRIAPEALPGDQVRPDIALNANGGYIVWEDNTGDGDGLSVNYRRINGTLSGQFEVVGLATQTADNQEHPRVSMLADGGAAFVWQGGPDGNQKVFLRMMTPEGLFFSDEIPVSAHADVHQINPAVAGLSNGNVIVVWAAHDQDGSMQGVFGALYGPNGQKLGAEFQINQFSEFNQRSPGVAALPEGKFAVTWVSEGQRTESSVDIYARVFNANGQPAASEFRVNTSERVASSPAVAVTATGNMTFAWCEVAQDPNTPDMDILAGFNQDGWDIYACSFNINGRISNPSRVNQQISGTQRNPSLAAIGTAHMVVWSSLGQDGDSEGVVGRALSGIGTPEGNEQVVNTTTLGRQVYPVVRGDGEGRFVVAWSSFVSLAANLELMAQRFNAEQSAVTLPQAPTPFVSALTPSRLSVAWAPVAGYDVQNYELYVDGNPNPVIATNNMTVVGGFTPGSSHTFELAYRLLDGQLSPRSMVATGITWKEDANFDGLPDDWQAKYWGADQFQWPYANSDSDGDGVSNQREYMAGTDPTNPASVLKTQLSFTSMGWRLSWNTTPGFMYQVQQTTDLSTWTDLGGQRFAPDTTDSVSVPVGSSLGYYRVNRIR